MFKDFQLKDPVIQTDRKISSYCRLAIAPDDKLTGSLSPFGNHFNFLRLILTFICTLKLSLKTFVSHNDLFTEETQSRNFYLREKNVCLYLLLLLKYMNIC